MVLSLGADERARYLSFLFSGSVHLGLIAFFAFGLRQVHPPDVTPVTIEIVHTQGTKEGFEISRSKVQSKPLPVQKKEIATEASIPASESMGVDESQAEASEGSAPQGRLAENAQEVYIAEIIRLVNAKKSYPEMARRLRQEGRVLLKFRLASDGSVVEARVVTPSTHVLLNQSAEQLIKQLNGLKPFPNEIKQATLLFTVPIDYKM